MEYPLAGVGPRMLSIMLDIIFKYSYYIFIAYISFNSFMEARVFDEMDETYAQLRVGLFIVLLLPGVFYQLLCEVYLNGQSFGKKIIRIKVIKTDGTQPGFGSYFVRWLFRIIDDSIIGIICIAASRHTQRIGDMIAGTTVIELKKKAGLSDTILMEEKQDYKITYSQVAMLSDTDANIIKEVIDFSVTQDKPVHMSLLAGKIKSKYGISDVKQNDKDFLITVLQDYTHYQFEK